MTSLSKILIGLVCASLVYTNVSAAETPTPYRVEQPVSETIRIWGPASMSAVTRNWVEGFKRFHPDAKFEITLKGSASAMPGLYSARADIALIGRENNLTDNNGFGRVKQYKPLRLELMGGSVAVPGKGDALVVLVHKDNPIAQLSVDQLDALFGYERRRGLPAIRTWGDLGLVGEWADKSVNLHTYDLRTGTGDYFRRIVLGGSHKMNWDAITEYKDSRRSDGTLRKAAESISAAASLDRYALAISSLRHVPETLKPIALAASADQPYVQANTESVIARSYPLSRPTYAFVDVPPGKAMEPKLREFLRYALSVEGQNDIARDRGFVPLSSERSATQLQVLEASRVSVKAVE